MDNIDKLIREAVVANILDLHKYRELGDEKYLRSFVEFIIDATSEPTPDWKAFRADLAPKEESAFKHLYAFHILPEGGETHVSIVKLIEATTISRPVWTSLLAKMTKHHIAEVENKGVKGTHIKMLIKIVRKEDKQDV